jgi:hypothetical protein
LKPTSIRPPKTRQRHRLFPNSGIFLGGRLYPPLNYDDPGGQIASSKRETMTIVSSGNLKLEPIREVIESDESDVIP